MIISWMQTLQWTKGFRCVVSAGLILAHVAADADARQRSEEINTPGLYRLGKSNDDASCLPIQREINRGISAHKKFPPPSSRLFLKWHLVAGKDLDGYYQGAGEPVNIIEADFDGDGKIDTFINSKWSVGSTLEDMGHILFDRRLPRPLNLPESVKKGFPIHLNSNLFIQQQQRKHGELATDWILDGQPQLEIARIGQRVFVVARSLTSRPSDPSQIYVFAITKWHDTEDLCMLDVVCPCGGCEGLNPQQNIASVPHDGSCGTRRRP